MQLDREPVARVQWHRLTALRALAIRNFFQLVFLKDLCRRTQCPSDLNLSDVEYDTIRSFSSEVFLG